VLKNSLIRKWLKKLCARMPYKRLPRFSWTFSIPPIFRGFEENGLFQQLQAISLTTRSLVAILKPIIHAGVPLSGPSSKLLRAVLEVEMGNNTSELLDTTRANS